MRGLAWIGYVLLLAACTRENGAFSGGGSASEEGTSRTDGDDDPVPSTGSASASASGSGVDGTSTGERPSTGGNTSEATTMPLDGTTESASAEEAGTTGATTDAPGTTGEPPPESCCDPFVPCENSMVSECACLIDNKVCCGPGWGLYCVAIAMSADCLGACMLPPQSCCESFGPPGCNNPEIMACVCETQPSCCDISWDGGCASQASKCDELPCL